MSDENSGENFTDVKFSRTRRTIADRMTASLQSSAQLTAVAEIDMTHVAEQRERLKASFQESAGFSLTFLPFIAMGLVETLRSHPEFNACILEDGKTARVFDDVNLGVAIGRDEGLIVPVIRNANRMDLSGLAHAINDVATRARARNALTVEDVTGGTFTLTNYGSFGTLIDTPIINHPQVAILGVGSIAKRPAVVTIDGRDEVQVRRLAYFSLTYDHRWIDGHKAGAFNSTLRKILEHSKAS